MSAASFPLVVRCIGWFEVVVGALSLVDVGTGIADGHLRVNPGFLFLPAGFLLLRRAPSGRTLSLVLLALGTTVEVVLGLGFLLGGTGEITMTAFGMSFDEASRAAVAAAFLACAVPFAVCWYGLSRPGVRELFRADLAPGASGTTA